MTEHVLRRAAAAAIVSGSAAFVWAGPPASFQGLGFAPGMLPESYATAVSADGSTVVGWNGQSYVAVRWRAETGMVSLGSLGFSPDSIARAVSADGSVVVGYTRMPPPDDRRPFRWTMAGMQPLVGPGLYSSEGYGVSWNGQVVVGTFATASGYLPFRWIEGAGFIGVSMPQGATDGGATAVSGDGRYVIGTCRFPTSAPYCGVGFRWTDGSPPQQLGDLPGAEENSQAMAASFDGSVITGWSASTLSPSNGNSAGEAFRWTTSAGMTGLGLLPGGGATHALAISGDGDVIAGTGTIGSGAWHAFVWRASTGVRDLKEALETDFGLNLAGWTLVHATGASADGTVIVGYGTDPQGHGQAWMARLPAPCYANCDGSTASPVLNMADFTCFLQRYAGADPYANCDGSTAAPVLNVADFTCFLRHYAAGCP